MQVFESQVKGSPPCVSGTLKQKLIPAFMTISEHFKEPMRNLKEKLSMNVSRHL